MLISKGTTEDDAINIANDGTAGLPLVAARDEDDTQHLLEFKETAAEVIVDGIVQTITATQAIAVSLRCCCHQEQVHMISGHQLWQADCQEVQWWLCIPCMAYLADISF